MRSETYLASATASRSPRWAQAIGISAFTYFGDLDERGLRIPYGFNRLMSKFNLSVSLDAALYIELLKAPTKHWTA